MTNRIDRRQSPKHVQVRLAARSLVRRDSSSRFPTQDTSTLARLSRYPMFNLTPHALFACALAQESYGVTAGSSARSWGRSAYRHAAE